MKAEITRELAEQKELEKKAAAYDRLIAICGDALSFMRDQKMSASEVAKALGITFNAVIAIEDEDLDAFLAEVETSDNPEEEPLSNENIWGVSQLNHGHEYRWIFTAEEIRKQTGWDPVDEACEDIHWPIGGSNSSATSFKRLQEDEDFTKFFSIAGEPDSDDPTLVEIAEYMLTFEGGDGAVTEKYAKKYCYSDDLKNLERLDDCYDRQTEIEYLVKTLAAKDCDSEDFDVDDPFYGRNKDMTYNEFMDLCDQYLINTKRSIAKTFDGFNSRYSTFKLVWASPWIEPYLDSIVKVLNELGIDPDFVSDGYKDKDGSVTFCISEMSPFLIYELTRRLCCIGYADTDWDSQYVLAARNGEKYNDYKAEWTEGSPEYREDDESWDAFVTLTDTLTGIIFRTGSGACGKDAYEYYKNIVETHK